MGGVAYETLKEIKTCRDFLEASVRAHQERMASASDQTLGVEDTGKYSETLDISAHSFVTATNTSASISRQLAYAMRYLDTMILGWENLGQYSKYLLISYFWTVESIAISLGFVRFHKGSVEYPKVFERVMGGKAELKECSERLHAVAKRYAAELLMTDDE